MCKKCLKIVQKLAKMTKIAQKKAKTFKKLLEKPKISTPVKKIALTVSAAFSISGSSFFSPKNYSCAEMEKAADAVSANFFHGCANFWFLKQFFNGFCLFLCHFCHFC